MMTIVHASQWQFLWESSFLLAPKRVKPDDHKGMDVIVQITLGYFQLNLQDN